MVKYKYIEVLREQVPASSLRWDTPGYYQGQEVVVQYGTFGRYEAGEGADWKRVADKSAGPLVTNDWQYFKLEKDLENG